LGLLRSWVCCCHRPNLRSGSAARLLQQSKVLSTTNTQHTSEQRWKAMAFGRAGTSSWQSHQQLAVKAQRSPDQTNQERA
jgi:hypothetical protein